MKVIVIREEVRGSILADATTFATAFGIMVVAHWLGNGVFAWVGAVMFIVVGIKKVFDVGGKPLTIAEARAELAAMEAADALHE